MLILALMLMLMLLVKARLNPRTYTQTYTPTVIQGGGGGGGRCCNPSPRFLQCYNIWETDSLSCDLQDEVNIMGNGAAEGLRHPKWPPRWPPFWILLKIQIYRENLEIANIFCWSCKI